MNNTTPIIITGSSGLLGGRAIRDFDERFQVVGFDRDGEPQPPPRVECVCVDLTDDASVDLGLERTAYAYGKELAAVIHFAAYASFAHPQSPLYEKVTVQGTRRLIEALNRKGFQVGRFIFSSTMLVHRPTEPGRPINEDDPLEGKWAYPQSKIRTERIIHEYRQGMPVAILRIAGVYNDEGNSIPIGEQIDRIRQRSLTSRVYPGDITHGQSFIHLDDLMDAISRCLDRREELPEETVMLLGEPVTYSYDQLQRAIAECLHGEGDEWDTQIIPKELAKTGSWIQGKIPGIEKPFIQPWMVDIADDHYELDISRARQLLGWEPKRRLIDTIPSMCGAVKREQAKSAA